MDSLEPGAVLGQRFRLERKLGQGGMGAVFQATDLQLKRLVAIKVLLPDTIDDPETLSRFATEARAIGALAHPNIGALLDFHAALDPVPFLVLEFIDGESLRALLLREQRLPAQRAVHIAQQMLAALGVAHAAGTIHRDIKPANVMMVPGTADPDFVRIIDFGVARVAESITRQHRTSDGAILGTPQYMAPEQAMGLPVHPGVDVYAVAVCLFEMIAGYNPFAVGKPVFVFAAVRDVVPPALSQVQPEVPRALSDVVARALAKLPSARFASPQEFSTALTGALSGVPAPAHFQRTSDETLREAPPTVRQSFHPVQSSTPVRVGSAPDLPFASTVHRPATSVSPPNTPSVPHARSSPGPFTLIAGAAALVLATAALTAVAATLYLQRVAVVPAPSGNAAVPVAASASAQPSAANSAASSVAPRGAAVASSTPATAAFTGSRSGGLPAHNAPAPPKSSGAPPPPVPIFDPTGDRVCERPGGERLCASPQPFVACRCIVAERVGLCQLGDPSCALSPPTMPVGAACSGQRGGEPEEGAWGCWFDCSESQENVRGVLDAPCSGYRPKNFSPADRAPTSGQVRARSL